MHLFQTMPNFIMHSGDASNFKIECDVLTEEDMDTLAYLISKKMSFGTVWGIPTGGTKLAVALNRYISDNSSTWLIVDDVLTTGRSMDNFREIMSVPQEQIKGVVIFARTKCPDWVIPIFQMW